MTIGKKKMNEEMYHFTENTRHETIQKREDVSHETLETMIPFVEKLIETFEPLPIPGMSDYWVEPLFSMPNELRVNIGSDDRHLVAMACMLRPREKKIRQCSVDLNLRNLRMKDATWLGDFERCFFWAWESIVTKRKTDER